MSSNAVQMPWSRIAHQPMDVRSVPDDERDVLIVSAVQQDGAWVVVSRYGNDQWVLSAGTTNLHASAGTLDYTRVPAPFRAVMKAVMYRYLRRGREGQVTPKTPSVVNVFQSMVLFLRHLDRLKLKHLGAVTALVCSTYVAECKAIVQTLRNKGKPLSPGSLNKRFIAVEALHELSQHTHDPMRQPPWPDTSVAQMAGTTGKGHARHQGGRTPLMSDAVFTTLFQHAHVQLAGGDALLNLRDALEAVAVHRAGQSKDTVIWAKNRHLAAHGWKGGLSAFGDALLHLRDACYVVIASTSGCRNHELANLQSGAYHRTEDDEGLIYHWMRTKSEKTDAGLVDFMVPDIAHDALRIMDRWAAPYQAMIEAEIVQRRAVDPGDPGIAEAQRHTSAVFVAWDSKSNQVRTLCLTAWNRRLKAFAKRCGQGWDLSSHQFRRKFANYAAHSQFGDLRYLKEHFHHVSMDMTLPYAIDQEWGLHLDLDLYADIQAELDDVKLGVAAGWLDSERLGGGYGRNIKKWQREPDTLALYKDSATMVRSIAESTAIRSNGHAWCTADDDGCVGNTMERTRCTGCDNAVIGNIHAGIYQRLYRNLGSLMEVEDIGPGGRMRVLRDLERCRKVLTDLGYDPEIQGVQPA